MNNNCPFIPTEKAKLAIIDGRVSEKFSLVFKDMGIKTIPTIKVNEVHDSISFHPDIAIHPLTYDTLVVAPNVFEYYEEMFYGTGIKLIKGEKRLGSKYPDDIAYNVARLDGCAIHNFKYTDEKLCYFLNKMGIEFIDVSQGYTKCSTAIVDGRAVITQDYDICKKLQTIGVDVLLVQSGYIDLPGFDYGFIGGCCGNISPNDIVFSGILKYHPDSKKIFKFLKKHNKNVYFLSDNNILDVGTIISLGCK